MSTHKVQGQVSHVHTHNTGTGVIHTQYRDRCHMHTQTQSWALRRNVTQDEGCFYTDLSETDSWRQHHLSQDVKKAWSIAHQYFREQRFY